MPIHSDESLSKTSASFTRGNNNVAKIVQTLLSEDIQ